MQTKACAMVGSVSLVCGVGFDFGKSFSSQPLLKVFTEIRFCKSGFRKRQIKNKLKNDKIFGTAGKT